MNHVTQIVTVPFLLFSAVVAKAQDPERSGTHILRLADAPEEHVYQLTTRLRHTTVITLPAGESILDYVVGDAEYWHLTGSANVAFLKPVAEGIETNIALVCASGRIYTFLVQENSLVDPNLVVRIEVAGSDPDSVAGVPPGGLREPVFVSRDQVRGFELMASQAQLELANVRAEALAELDAFRADYPTRIRFAYEIHRDAADWPWLIEGMWHDGQFTYIRSSAQEAPAIYEEQDGAPSLIPYDLHGDGLFVIRRIVGEGWFQIGDERLEWAFTPPGRER